MKSAILQTTWDQYISIVVGNLDIIDRNNFKKLHIYFDVGDFSISVYYFFKFLYIALEKKLYSALLNASFN